MGYKSLSKNIKQRAFLNFLRVGVKQGFPLTRQINMPKDSDGSNRFATTIGGYFQIQFFKLILAEGPYFVVALFVVYRQQVIATLYPIRAQTRPRYCANYLAPFFQLAREIRINRSQKRDILRIFEFCDPTQLLVSNALSQKIIFLLEFENYILSDFFFAREIEFRPRFAPVDDRAQFDFLTNFYFQNSELNHGTLYEANSKKPSKNQY